jgi:NAD(P)-dependent dehydrogenase (short-subunit alcohol dehydrogenase family)
VAHAGTIATQEGAAAIVDAALSAFGAVTVLINNAGIIDNTPFAEVTPEQWRHMSTVTLDGTYHMTSAVWPLFVRNGYGRIVNTTSNVGYAGMPTLVPYGAMKLGVAGFTRGLAHETGDLDIRVNAIAPFAVTRMNRDVIFGDQTPVTTPDWQADIRGGRVPLAPPVAVPPTVLWLAHRSTDVNGEIYTSNSGHTARVAFVVGSGYFNPDHTPEDLRDNLSAVRSLDSYLEPQTAFEEIDAVTARFRSGS